MAELKYLGRQVSGASSPVEFELDRVRNPSTSASYAARFTCPEFTSICPATGQPDFAHLVIDYVPNGWLVESKSLKLFLSSFRNHGAFHEACTMMVVDRLAALLEPAWLRVAAYWYPRGGISIDVFYHTGEPPKGVLIPELQVAPLRGRG